MSEPANAAVVDIDPFSDEFLADPYPFHDRVRETGPVVWLKPYGIWASARYEPVQQALQDWRTFSSAAGVGLADFRKETPFRPPSLVLEADPPLHDRTRPVLAAALSSAFLRELRAPFTAVAEALIDDLLDRRTFDAVADLGEVYPVQVFADALGLPEDGRENLLPYAAMVFNAFGPDNHLLRQSAHNAEPVRAWIGRMCERASLRPGSLGARVFEGADRGEVSEEEAALLVRSLLSAGLDTTAYGLANALFALASNPDQWTLLRDDPSLARGAYEEALRFESPVQNFFRTTTCVTDLGGVQLGEGEKILLFLGAANRDPRRWDDADRFDIRRKAGGHVGFGYGIHACVGQIVARMEGEIVLDALARKVRTLTLAGAPVLRANNTLRGLQSLPLSIA